MESELCKYCGKELHDVTAEGLNCHKCSSNVHVACLQRGSVPGGLIGDVFFTFTCLECSGCDQEIFVRDRMPWMQAIVLVMYQFSMKNTALARSGYYHWKTHLATYIDTNWEVIFCHDYKRRKKWIGTVAGTLSHYNPYFFYSGTPIFGEQGWWTLTFPRLTPNAIMKINAKFMAEKMKPKGFVPVLRDVDIFRNVVESMPYEKQHTVCLLDGREVPETPSTSSEGGPMEDSSQLLVVDVEAEKPPTKKKTLSTLERFELSAKRYRRKGSKRSLEDSGSTTSDSNGVESYEELKTAAVEVQKPLKYMDPMCHYNTSLSNLSRCDNMTLSCKLMGDIREEFVLSPYSSLYLKPYIWRDPTSRPKWIELMNETLLKANKNVAGYETPPRAAIDYVYVQPSHIPAVNSLCNQFFWPGIDLTDVLQYPDFSCVVMYRKLIIGFGFVVPDIKFHENYISFVFVRPGWRNVGFGRFILYHLIQTSSGKDLTLHVSINNPALFLYQKFGFKVEHVVQNFYDKYYTKDSRDSKHAFFCRLER